MRLLKRSFSILLIFLVLGIGRLAAQQMTINVKADPPLKIFINGSLDFNEHYGIITAGQGATSISKENGAVIQVKGNAKNGKFGRCIEAKLDLEDDTHGLLYHDNSEDKIPVTIKWAYKSISGNIIEIPSEETEPPIRLYPENNSAWWSAYLYIYGTLENYDPSISLGQYRGNILVEIEQEDCD